MSLRPIDTATGHQAGGPVHTGTVDVIKGYLITLPNGFETLIRLDKARADLYAAANHGTVEVLFVRRELPR